MFQVRFHGRGGQGVVTAAELLASAAFGEDRHAQAFPSLGRGGQRRRRPDRLHFVRDEREALADA